MSELASVSHQLPSSCRSRVIFSLLSAAIAPDISIDEAIVQMTQLKLSKFCLLFGESEDYLAAGCCCRLNGKNLQMFGVNLCIVSPLGAVLVHNLEGRGILSCAHNHPSRDGSEIAKTEIRRHFQRGREGDPAV